MALRKARASARTVARAKGLFGRLKNMGLTARQVVLNALILVLFIIPVVFLPHPIGYIPLVMYLLVLLMGWVYLCIVRKGFGLDAQIADEDFVRKGSLAAPIAVVNDSVLPIFRLRLMLRIVNPYGLPEGETDVWLMVDSHDREQVDARVTLGHVGVYAITLAGVVLFDPLGFLHVSVRADDRIEVVSNPQLVDIDSVEFSRMAMRESSAPIRTVISDGSDYAGVRDYELGDPLKSIHWKLSARTDDLQTRLFEVDVNTRTAVIVDFHTHEYASGQLMECRDALVEVALASLALVQTRGMEARLRSRIAEHDFACDRVPDGDELSLFTRQLPLASPKVDLQDAVGVIEEETTGRGACNNIIVCAADLTNRLVEALVSASSRRVNVVLVLAIPREERSEFNAKHAGLLSRLDATGIYVAVVSDASDLEVASDAQ